MPRFVHFAGADGPQWGRVADAGVLPWSGAPYAGGVPLDAPTLPLHGLRLLAPATPTKIIGVGRNYRAHAAELGHEVPDEPILFFKPPSALAGHRDVIRHPGHLSDLVHHEGELAVVLGKTARFVPAEEASSVIIGYTVINDVTARDLQRRDVQFTRAKGFDTFAPMGPWLDTDFVPGSQRLTVEVNGAMRQDSRLDQMVFSVGEVISRISRVMTLEPGDVIATGTPAGVGPLLPGDAVGVTIEGLGTLENTVEAEAHP